MVEEQVLTHSQEVAEQNLQIESITDLSRFNAIAGEWDRLIDDAGIERLIGAVPMMRSNERFYGLKINSIQSIYNPHTPRCDFIIAPGWADRVYPTAWNYLCNRTDCDMIAFRQVPDDSPTLAAIESLAQADGWLSGQWIAPASPYIPLNCTHDDLLKRLKGGYRYNLRKRYERLSKAGPIDVEVITEKERVREAMQDGLRIEAAAWKGERGTAIASDCGGCDARKGGASARSRRAAR